MAAKKTFTIPLDLKEELYAAMEARKKSLDAKDPRMADVDKLLKLVGK